MAGFSESSTVQAAVVKRLVDLGWEYIAGRDLPRSQNATFIQPHLIDGLVRLNPLIAEQRDRVDEVLPKLRAVALSAVNDGLVAANERMTTWLRGHQTLKYIGNDEYVPVRLVDFGKSATNRLVVSDEVTFGPPGHSRRFDVVLWVNGLPVVVGEIKTPVDKSKSWLNGANDIHDIYEVEASAFFATNVLSFATEGRELHYGAVDQPAEHWLMWGATTDPWDLSGGERVMRSIELLLSPAQVISILQDFVLFDRPKIGSRAILQKLIPRYPQVEGVEAIHKRVMDPTRRQGLIWHYQGTGKTLLMAFAALRLLNDPAVGGPTVVIVLDRIDLVEQTVRQFQTAGLPRLRVAGTKEQLRRMLAEDQRGIIVTTIFRFEGAGFLNDRDNIIVLVDEAHRTQEGRLGQDLRIAVPKAQFFGLTGTPISDAERNTFKLFGDPGDAGWVLNRYSIERSIMDGSSVPIHVETRLVDFHIDKAALDEAFAAMADEEGLSDDERELLADRAARARTIVRNPDRVQTVCADIVEHYLAKVAPLGLKAQVVAYDRELCVTYYEEISRLLAERGLEEQAEAAVVMTTSATKDEPAAWQERFGLSREQEAAVKARFRDPGDPLRLLIVTAKLLTGFDAEVEGVMYLDKPLRLHTLFQAICRTNRRWSNPVTGQEKLYGLIVDYVGLGTQIARALREADPDRGGRRPVDVDGLAEEFIAAIETALERFGGINRADTSFAALMAAQECVPLGDLRDAFAADFLRVQGMWEFLDPSPVTAAHRVDYRWLAQVYESVQPAGTSDVLLWQRLGAKTLELVHGHITEVRVTGSGLNEVIVDAETIEAIRQLALPDPGVTLDGAEPMTIGEALDTIEARIRRRLDTSRDHPIYVALSDRLERLRHRQLSQASASVEFLREILELARQVTAVERAEDQGHLDEVRILPDPNLGALTQIFREYAPADTPVIIENVVADIDTIVRQVRFTGWSQTQNGDRTVRREVRLTLKKYGLPTTGELFDRAYAYIRENY
jgi:type I restriction enzyme, R subunit